MPSCKYADITLMTGQNFDCLTELNSMKTWAPSEESLKVIENFPQACLLLIAHFTNCFVKCDLNSHEVRKSVKKLKKEVNACLLIHEKVSAKLIYNEFPQMVLDYLVELKEGFSTLSELLHRKFILEKKISTGDDKVKITKPHKVNVYINGRPARKPSVSNPVPPTDAAKVDPQAAASCSGEESIPGTTPAGGNPHEILPQEERLVKHLEVYNFKPEERTLLIGIFKYFEEARSWGDKTLFNPDSFKQRMYFGLEAGVDKVYRRLTGKKNPGKEMAQLFKGNIKDAENYVRNYHHPDPNADKNDILKGTRPELEELVQAWLNK